MISIDKNQLRIGGKSYLLANLSSAEIQRPAPAKWNVRLGVFIVIAGLIICFLISLGAQAAATRMEKFETMKGDARYLEAERDLKSATRATWAAMGLCLAGVVVAAWPKPRKPATQLLITMSSGEMHQIRFATEAECIQMRESILAAAGKASAVDARQIHIHNPPAIPE